jgi:hypothetical protein
MTPAQRSAVYALASSVGAVLLAYGAISEDQSASLVAAAVALVGAVTAFWNRPTKA